MAIDINSLPEARIAPPNLDNAEEYEKIPDVPILDSHYRVRRNEHGERMVDENGKYIFDYVSDDQLAVIVSNIENKCKNGDYPLIRVGHIDDEKPEVDQPPTAGFQKNFRLGKIFVNGKYKAVIMSDWYIDKNKFDSKELLKEYPRRSVEIVGKTDPEGFIDATAILKRMPARHLGLLTYSYQMNDSTQDPEEDMTDEMMSKFAGMIAEKFGAVLDAKLKTKHEAEKEKEKEHEKEREREHEKMKHYEAKKEKHESEKEEEEQEEDHREERRKRKEKEKEEEKDEYGAACPSATNVTTPLFVKKEEHKEKHEGHKKEHMSSLDIVEKYRMENDQLRIKLERQQADINSIRSSVAEIQAENVALKSAERRASIEKDLVQLEAENYQFDRVAEFEHLSSLPESLYDAGLARIRNYPRSAVHQPLLPIDVDKYQSRAAIDRREAEMYRGNPEEAAKMAAYGFENGITDIKKLSVAYQEYMSKAHATNGKV